MKIVRTFKDDKHPSIISFHSFIMTPSYAMITMYVQCGLRTQPLFSPPTDRSPDDLLLPPSFRTYLPTLVPVEVDESKCREWFHFLLSGVDFLHRRGVVHNDIK